MAPTIEIDQEPADILGEVGRQLRDSPLSEHLAAYIDHAGDLRFIMRVGIAGGIHPDHETVVSDCLVRIIEDAAAL